MGDVIEFLSIFDTLLSRQRKMNKKKNNFLNTFRFEKNENRVENCGNLRFFFLFFFFCTEARPQ